MRDVDEIALCVVYPAVESACHDGRFLMAKGFFAPRLRNDFVAPMPTHVVKRVDAAILAAHQDHRSVSEIQALDLEVAGIRDLLRAADAEPVAFEYLFDLGFIVIVRKIGSDRNRGRAG